jgi:hypothetical protein
VKRILILGSVLLLMSAIAVPTAADHTRPFKGSFTGPDVFDFTAPGCAAGAALRFSNTGPGEFSHLGRTVVAMDHCTYVEDAPLPLKGWTRQGITVLTAANGDSLTLEHEARFVMVANPAGPNPPYESATSTLVWTVKDGTGRFEGASGHGTGSSVDDMLAGIQTFWFRGEIAY